MAKKQSISYGPDSALIRGEADIARSKAMLSSAGGTAFAQGLTGAVISGIQEQEERNSIRDAYLDDLGGIDNIYKLEDGFNKEQVSTFVRSKKDEYAKAADCFARTKDQGCREQMEEIKFSFQNLNTQLDAYMNDKIQYNTAYDQGQIVDLKDDDKYTYMYTNNSDFSIESNGDIGFTSKGKYDKYKDVVGKWNTRQYKTEANALQAFSNATRIGEQGKNFFRDDIKNAFVYELQQSGTRGIQVMAKTDLTGDNQYVLGKDKDGKPILSGNQSFEAMWDNGYLDKKFYQEIPKGSDISWMDKKENSNLLANMIAEYHTDVANYYYNKGKVTFDAKQQQRQGSSIASGKTRGTLPVNYGVGYITTQSANLLLNDIKNKEKNINFAGRSYRFDKNKNTYLELGEDGKQTPVSNKKILMSAEIWQQGYRVEDFTINNEAENNIDQEYSTPNMPSTGASGLSLGKA
jgi:hypothetical protein